MSMNDLISDTLTRIRNAQMVGHEYVLVPSSTHVVDVLKVLKEEGYIEDIQQVEKTDAISLIKVDLKYHNGEPVIKVIERVSKSGRRVYKKIKEMPKFRGGLGIYVVSTPRGVMSDHEARNQNVGGELICRVF